MAWDGMAERNILNEFKEFDVDPEYEQFDDSDADPDYLPSEKSSSDVENAEEQAEIEMMAIQLEINLDESTIEETNSKDTKKTRKLKRNSGKSYITEKGVKVMQRECKELQQCRKKCNKKVSRADQLLIFSQYWDLGSYDLRAAYVAGLIDIQPKKTQRLVTKNPAEKIRSITPYYSLQINGKKIDVCKACFLKTIGETPKFVETVIAKLQSSGNIKDLRGKHPAAKKISNECLLDIKSHIDSFPAYESHYTRRDTSKKYLPADLTISKMYRLYCETREIHVSFSKYCEIFNTMNLKFKAPKTDTCNTCDVLKAKIDVAMDVEKALLLSEQKKHHEDADQAYRSKENDKSSAQADQSAKIYTFDLQQCLPTPYFQTSVSFYKRQLWTYNLTVHDCNTNQPYCYMWHEASGNRGGNEIASCLFSHLKSLPSHTKRVIFYSDSCGGQNKNTIVATMFLAFLQSQSEIDVIDHKFLVVGHTHMECDSDHAVIERQKKKTQIKIHHPRDWFQFVRTVGSKNSFNVIEMNQMSFLNFSLAAKSKLMWRKNDIDGNQFSWRSVRWLRYTKEHGVVEYKTSLNESEPFKKLNLRRRGINEIKADELQICYSEPIAISKEKKKDILDMIDLIDPEYREFYKNLPTSDVLNFHPDLTEFEEPNEN